MDTAYDHLLQAKPDDPWLLREARLAEVQARGEAEDGLESSGSTAICGPNDQPEPGLQGQTSLADMVSTRSQRPYFCGLHIVGHSDIYDRGGNLQLARSQRCAYVATAKPLAPFVDLEDPVTTRVPAGVAVIDVRDPRTPKPVGLLRDPGSIDSVETLDALDAGRRHVLVAGDYSGGNGPAENPNGSAALDIYDVTDCARPKHMATYYWPRNVHDITLSPNGHRVYGTGKRAMFVLDIRQMKNPQLVSEFDLILPDGQPSRIAGGELEFPCHTVTFNAQETRMYCAGSVSKNAQPDDEPSNSLWIGSGPTIWDVSEFSSGNPDPQIHFVGESAISGQGGHHAVPAKINGKDYLIASNELAVARPPVAPLCEAAAYPRIWDISNMRRPRVVGEFKLEVQEHCDAPGVRAEIVLGTVASHYNNVNSRHGKDATLGLFSFTAAGLRIVDLRNPSRPKEVAYYKPGANPVTTLQPAGASIFTLFYNPNLTDACMSRNLYIPRTGEIWFACASNGFYVAKLSRRVIKYLASPAEEAK